MLTNKSEENWASEKITVKVHWGQVMQKMKANSLAELVRMCAKLRPARHAIDLA